MSDAANADHPAPSASADLPAATEEHEQPQMSKSARKKLLKQQRIEKKKAERKIAEKERRKQNLDRRRREWDEELVSAADDEERSRLVEARKQARRERMATRAADREERASRLRNASEIGQKIIIDLEFADLMTGNEIQSLVHQLMFCYAANGKCASPAHLIFTGCKGEIQNKLQRLPGYERWIMGKEHRSYIDAFEDLKHNLVYLTADSDVELDDLDLKKIYIIGGIVDRNRWKGVTLEKAQEQGIQTARLPISTYLKLSSSQVLTVNQVFEILLKFIETKDWKDAFYKVIPQRKRSESEVEHGQEAVGNEAECLHFVTENLYDVKEMEYMTGEEEEDNDKDVDDEREAKKIRLEQSEN